MRIILKNTKNTKNLKKSRADLVKVQVMVNGRTGQYSSHRWKNPQAALNMLKDSIKAKKGESIQFKDKKTGKKLSEEEFLETFKNDKSKDTIQQYVKKNYTIVRSKKQSDKVTLGDEASNNYKITSENYQPITRGQITKFEANLFYSNYKKGNIEAKPEFSQMLYDKTKEYIKFAQERYNQDSSFYDHIENMTISLLDKKYDEAQKHIDAVQDDLINNAGKKSRWRKYQVGKNQKSNDENPLNLKQDGNFPYKNERNIWTKNNEILMPKSDKRHSYWISQITDTDSKYKFKREFINYDNNEKEDSKFGNRKKVPLEEGGIYNWLDSDNRYYGVVNNGELWIINENQVTTLLNSTERNQEKTKNRNEFKQKYEISELEGTPKQIEYAERFRNEYIDKYIAYQNEELKTDNVRQPRWAEKEAKRLEELSTRIDHGKRYKTALQMYRTIKHDAELNTYEGQLHALELIKEINDKALEVIALNTINDNRAEMWIDNLPINFIPSKTEDDYWDMFNQAIEDCKIYEEEQKEKHNQVLKEIEQGYKKRGLKDIRDNSLSVEQIKQVNECRNSLYDQFLSENEELDKLDLDEETKRRLEYRTKFLEDRLNYGNPRRFLKFIQGGVTTPDEAINYLNKKELNEDTGFPDVKKIIEENQPDESNDTPFIPYRRKTIKKPSKEQHEELTKKSQSLISTSPQVGSVLKVIQNNPESTMTDKILDKNKTNLDNKLEGKDDQEKKQELKQEMDSLYSKLKAGMDIQALMADPNISRALYLFLAEISDDEDILDSVIDEIMNLM